MKLKLMAFAIAGFAFSQSNAQTMADANVQSKICKDWKIDAYEMFGTVNQLEDNEKADHIIFNKDFTCTAVEHGKETKASWTIDAGMKAITIIPSNKHRRVYKITMSNDKQLNLLYQDSVLIKRTYHMTAK